MDLGNYVFSKNGYDKFLQNFNVFLFLWPGIYCKCNSRLMCIVLCDQANVLNIYENILAMVSFLRNKFNTYI